MLAHVTGCLGIANLDTTWFIITFENWIQSPQRVISHYNSKSQEEKEKYSKQNKYFRNNANGTQLVINPMSSPYQYSHRKIPSSPNNNFQPSSATFPPLSSLFPCSQNVTNHLSLAQSAMNAHKTTRQQVFILCALLSEHL